MGGGRWIRESFHLFFRFFVSSKTQLHACCINLGLPYWTEKQYKFSNDKEEIHILDHNFKIFEILDFF